MVLLPLDQCAAIVRLHVQRRSICIAHRVACDAKNVILLVSLLRLVQHFETLHEAGLCVQSSLQFIEPFHFFGGDDELVLLVFRYLLFLFLLLTGHHMLSFLLILFNLPLSELPQEQVIL